MGCRGAAPRGVGGSTEDGARGGTAATSGSATATGPATAESFAARTARLRKATLTIGWVGDITPGSMYGNPPDHARPLFAHLLPELRRPDLMLGNLEGTLSKGGTSKCSGRDPKICYAFQAPPENAAALASAGFDFMNLANNHTRDFLDTGMAQTLAALRKNQVRWIGISDEPASLANVRGVRVALIGFSAYSWSPRMTNIPDAARRVREAAGEADVVVTVMHAGAEGADKTHTPAGAEMSFGEDRGRTRDFAHAVVDAGADVVLGSGPHVIRGIERYRGKLIAYSVGNFAGWHNFSSTGINGLAALLTIRLDGTGAIRGGRWLSLVIHAPGVPRVDPSQEAVRLGRRLSREDFAQTFKLDANGVFGTR